MTALDIGVMLIRTRMEWTSIALLGGFALIKQNKVTVLVNQAETHATIDPEQAEKTYQEAQRQWVEAVGAKEKVKPISPSREHVPDCNWSKPSNSPNKDYHR
jgi:F0F1-type ATP synthase epsilon subunit